MVQQGAVRACLKLLRSDDLDAKVLDVARQTLAKLLIVTDPHKVCYWSACRDPTVHRCAHEK